MVEKLKEKIKEIERFQLSEEDYDELLDETHENVQIGELTFSPSEILKKCDEVAYRIGRGEEDDYKRENLKEDVNQELTDALSDEEITEEEYDELYKRLEQI